MATQYKFISMAQITSYLPEVIHEQVSARARSPGQFIATYKKYGRTLTPFWCKKRNAFIARSYAAYLLNPTRRRYLSLICWAFKPKEL